MAAAADTRAELHGPKRPICQRLMPPRGALGAGHRRTAVIRWRADCAGGKAAAGLIPSPALWGRPRRSDVNHQRCCFGRWTFPGFGSSSSKDWRMSEDFFPAVLQRSLSGAGALRGIPAVERLVQCRPRHAARAPLSGSAARGDQAGSCTRGAVFDVAVDVRAGSRSRGRWVGVELSADNGSTLHSGGLRPRLSDADRRRPGALPHLGALSPGSVARGAMG